MLAIYLTQVLGQLVSESGGVLLYFFCDSTDEKRNGAVAILRGLSYQLLKQQPQLVNVIHEYFNGPKQELDTISSSDSLWNVFRTMLQKTGQQVFCVVDGLDECRESSLRPLLKKLSDFFSQTEETSSGRRLKFLVLSRDWPPFIERQLYRFPRINLDTDSEFNVKSDVEIYISAKVDELAMEPERIRLTDTALERVSRALKASANGTFLWVGFVADELKGHPEEKVEEILQNVPKDLYGIYKRILLQIEDDDRLRVALILKWVVLSLWPLTLTELAVATGVQDSDTQTREDIMKSRLEPCGRLLRIDNRRVHLVHQSTKDYLQLDSPYDEEGLEVFRVKKTEGHLILAKTCLEYIQSGPFDESYIESDDETSIESPSESGSATVKYPLVKYATLPWSEHIRLASDDGTGIWSDVIEGMFDLSHPFCCEESEIRDNWWRFYRDGSSTGWQVPLHASLMHLAAYFGIPPLARKLMRAKGRRAILYRNPGNMTDDAGRTPLYWAVMRGHKNMVKLLLDNGANMKSKYEDRMTVLHMAARQGHTEIVELLLASKANVKAKTIHKRTPLHLAAEFGYMDIVKLLLDSGANIQAKDHDEMTPLLYAANKRYIDIVKLLVDNGANIEAKDWGKRTSLHLAADWGQIEIVKLLLDNGADIDAKDEDERTALHLTADSAEYGGIDIARLLLDNGARINARDWDGMTALSLAVDNRNVDVVWLLVENGANPEEATDWRKRPILHWAAERGYSDLVKLLLEKGADINATDTAAVTALHLAIKCSNFEIINLLLDRGANIEMKEIGGATPLAMAIDNGLAGVLDLLLAKGASVNYVYRLPVSEST